MKEFLYWNLSNKMRLESTAHSIPLSRTTNKSLPRRQTQLCSFIIVLICYQGHLIHANPINRQAGISENVYITVQNDTYGIEQRVCSIDSLTYDDGESIPTSSPCEHCICRPPGFACTIISCEYRPGCKSLKRSDQCCPEYQCECEANGKIYQNGEKILDDNNPCEVCYCQGGDVICAVIDCYWRSDCQPRYIENRCCPLYDHCPPPSGHGQLRPTQTPTTISTTTFSNPSSWLNMSSAIYATASTTRKSFTSSTLSPPTTTTTEIISNNAVNISSTTNSLPTSEEPNSLPVSEEAISTNILQTNETHAPNTFHQTTTFQGEESVSEQSVLTIQGSPVNNEPLGPPSTSEPQSSEVLPSPTPISTSKEGGPLPGENAEDGLIANPTESIPTPLYEMTQGIENIVKPEISSESPEQVAEVATPQATLPETDLGASPIQSNTEISLPESLMSDVEINSNVEIAQKLNVVETKKPLIASEQSRPELLEISAGTNSQNMETFGTNEVAETTISPSLDMLPLQVSPGLSTQEKPMSNVQSEDPPETTPSPVFLQNAPVSEENELYDNTLMGQPVVDTELPDPNLSQSNKNLNNQSESGSNSSGESSTLFSEASDANPLNEPLLEPIPVPKEATTTTNVTNPVDPLISALTFTPPSDEHIFSGDTSKTESPVTPLKPTSGSPIGEDTPTLSSVETSGDILEDFLFVSTTLVPQDAEESPTSTSGPSISSLEGQESKDSKVPHQSQQIQPNIQKLGPVGGDAVNGADELSSMSLNTTPTEATSQINPPVGNDKLGHQFTDSSEASSSHQGIPAEKNGNASELEESAATGELSKVPNTESPNLVTGESVGGVKVEDKGNANNEVPAGFDAIVDEPVLDVEETPPQSDTSGESRITELPETVTTSSSSISEFTTIQPNAVSGSAAIVFSDEQAPVFDEKFELPSQNPEEETTKPPKEDDILSSTDSPTINEITEKAIQHPNMTGLQVQSKISANGESLDSKFQEDFSPPNLPNAEDAVPAPTLSPLQDKYRLDLSLFSDDADNLNSGTEGPGTTVPVLNDGEVIFESIDVNSHLPASLAESVTAEPLLTTDPVNLTINYEAVKSNTLEDESLPGEKVLQRHSIILTPPQVEEDESVKAGTTEPPFGSDVDLVIETKTTDPVSEFKENGSKLPFGVELVKKVNPISDDIGNENSGSDLRSDAENEVSGDSSWYWRTLDRMRSLLPSSFSAKSAQNL